MKRGFPTPADPSLVHELQRLTRAAQQRMGIASREPFTPKVSAAVEKLSNALEGSNETELIAGIAAALEVLEELEDDDLDLSDEDVDLSQQLLDLMQRAKVRAFKPEPAAAPEPRTVVEAEPSIPIVEKTITVKGVELGPATDYDQLVLRQMESGQFFDPGDEPILAGPLYDVMMEVAGTPQHYHLSRAVGRLLTHDDPGIRGQAVWLLSIHAKTASICADLILEQVEPERRPLFQVPDLIASSRPIEVKLMKCLATLVEDGNQRARDFARRDILRADLDGTGLIYTMLRRDRDWVKEHRDAIARISPATGEILSAEL